MAIVTGLFIYPVKSCGGIKLSETHLLETGLAHDRQWMLVDADGRFVTQRTHPAMALIRTALDDDVLRLRAPGMGTDVEVPVSDFDADAAPRLRSAVFRSEVQTLVEGPVVNEWLSQYLGQPMRLASVQAALGGRPGGDDLAAGCLSVAGGVTGLAGCAEPASGGARRPARGHGAFSAEHCHS